MKREKTVKTLSYADILSLSKLFPNSYEFKSNCIGVGDKFIACLAVLFYPSMLDDLILTQLMCMSKYHVSMDFEPIEAERILPQIDRSIKELDSRLAQVNMSVADKDEASEELNDFRTFRIDMSRGQEKALAVTIRFWLKDENEDLLLQRLDALKAEIQGRYGIDCFLPAYEMQEQFLSLTSPSNSVMTPFPLLQTFARQIPFYGTSLRDPHGWYFGHSLTDEVVILDPFAATQQRTSFNMLFVGGMGAGKSSTLKSMMQDALAFGHRVFSLDIEGEQRVLAQQYGGTVIDFTKESINPLEIRPTGTSDDTDALTSSYEQELSRVLNFFKAYQHLDAEETSIILGELEELYASYQIFPKTNLAQLNSENYPKISNLIHQMSEKSRVKTEGGRQYVENMNARTHAQYTKLIAILKAFERDTLRRIFNQHSSINLKELQFVVFDLSKMQGLPQEALNALLFNVLTIMWQEVYRNRFINQDVLKDAEKRKYIICVIDEAHRFFKSEQEGTMDFISLMVRQARKNSAALWMASQSARDFYPTVSSNRGKFVDQMQSIFALVPYKVLMKQDQSDVRYLQELLPSFTDNEIASTLSFDRGQMLIEVAGEGKIIVNRFIHPEYLELFGGGR